MTMMTPRKKVLYIQPVHEGGMKWLAETCEYEVIVAPDPSRETILRLIADADAVVTRLTEIDRELIDRGCKLKAIARHGIGVDNIDVAYAQERNIAVITTGDANALAVAEHVIFAVGALHKRIHWLDGQIRLGNWSSRDRAGAREMSGRRLGIVGLGNIGGHIARIASGGFGMSIAYYDPFASPSTVEAASGNGYERLHELDELARQVDILTVHVPLTAQTRSLIDARRLALMKPGAIVANFARGGIVNEQALYNALTKGQLGGAALDVFEQEPPDANHPLLHLDNVILSPHCGYFTEESRERMSLRLAEGIADVLK